MKILLADDDPISRKIIAGFLTRFGYQTHAVNDGMEAWGILQTQTAPQIAIFDWMMPRMSGLDAVTRIRGLKRPERTYIILLSSRNSKLDIVKGLEAGADDYLVKPCDLAELQARLRVAERTIKHDQQLRKTIQELESLARRHHLLGNIVGKQVATERTPAPVPAPAPAETPTKPPDDQKPAPAPAPEPAEEKPAADAASLRDTFAKALGQIGMGAGSIDNNSSASIIPEFAVLLPMYLPDRQSWIDVSFEFDRRASHSACRTLLQRGANSPQELQDVLVEMIHLVSRAPAMTALKEAAGAVSLTAVPIDNPASPANASRPGGSCYIIRTDRDLNARVTEYATPAPAVSCPVAELSVGDVALEPVASAKDPKNLIASPGEVLTRNRLSAIHEEERTEPVKVVSIPSESRAHLPIRFS